MKVLAGMLSSSVSRTVVDRTGLTDAYKVQLKWGADAASASPDDLPGIFTAIQQQLGLKLEASHGPVQVLSSTMLRCRLETEAITKLEATDDHSKGAQGAYRLMRSVVLDLLTGFGTLVLALIVALVMHNIHNPATFLLAVSVLLFGVAYTRQLFNSSFPWLHGLLIGLSASIPVVLLGKMVVGSISGPMESAILVVPALICICGALARLFWSRHQRTPAFGIGLVLLLGLIVGNKTLSPRLLATGASHAINKPSPPFTLTKLDGSEVTLSSLKGHVVVMNFWATWCAPCLAEMPVYDAIHERFKDNPDVIFLLVNTGLNNDTPDKVRRFNETRHLQLPVALGTSQTAEAMNANLLPKLIILDKSGNIRLENSGFQGASKLQSSVTEEIEVLLASK